MPTPVPVSDLPPDLRGTAVPASDLPPDLASPSKTGSVPVTDEPKTGFDYAKDIAGKAFELTPLGHAWPIIQKGSEGLDKVLYDAGGWVTDKAAKVLPPEAAAALGFGTNFGGQVALALGGGIGGGKAAPLVENRARSLMQSALKPTEAAMRSGKGERAITTMLEGDANVSRAGIARLNEEITRLETAVENALRGSNATVDKVQALQPIYDVIRRYRNQVNPNADLATIQRAAREFLDHPLIQLMAQIPVQVAQDLKRGTYRVLGDASYGRGLATEAQRDAQKALASGLRQEIERVHPEVGPLNQAMGDAVNARNIAQRRVNVEGNANQIGLGALTHNPLGFVTWMLDRYGAGKSALARALHQNAYNAPRNVGTAAGAAAGAKLGSSGEDDL